MASSTGKTTLKSVQNSPFFHAHLQKGPLHDEEAARSWPGDDMWEDEEYAGDSSPPTVEIFEQEHSALGEHEWLPRASPVHQPTGYPIHRSTPNLFHRANSVSVPSNTSPTRTPASRPMTPDQDYADYFATPIYNPTDAFNPEPGAKRYHYLTRSQSAATYPPKPRVQHALYNPGFASSLYHIAPSPLRCEVDPREPDAASAAKERSTHPFSLSPQRNLSPIEERGFYLPERHESQPLQHGNVGDNVSMHSSMSKIFNFFFFD